MCSCERKLSSLYSIGTESTNTTKMWKRVHEEFSKGDTDYREKTKEHFSQHSSVATQKRLAHFPWWRIKWPTLFKANWASLALSPSALASLCFTDHVLSGLPPPHLQHRFATRPEPSTVCLLIPLAPGLVALLLFTLLFPPSLKPPLCLIFSCSLLSPLLAVKFHFTD